MTTYNDDFIYSGHHQSIHRVKQFSFSKIEGTGDVAYSRIFSVVFEGTSGAPQAIEFTLFADSADALLMREEKS